MRTGVHTRDSGKNRLGALGLALAVLAIGLGACGDREEPRRGAAPQAGVESFTFLGMGRDTELTDRLRGELSEKLGNAAVENRGLIDLEAGTPGVLGTRLPALDAINRQLNSPPGERVEHDMIRLMYRYARGKEAPFDLVELLFDPQTRRPLLFRMRFKGDDAGMVDALRGKHGPPAVDERRRRSHARLAEGGRRAGGRHRSRPVRAPRAPRRHLLHRKPATAGRRREGPGRGKGQGQAALGQVGILAGC